MSKQSFEERRNELFQLSDRLFGSAEELSLPEAEALLRATGIEPDEVVKRVRERMAATANSYSLAERAVPALLEQALAELGPEMDSSARESALFREARAAVKGVLDEVKRIRTRMTGGVSLTFASAYRKKRELSERDKKLLDDVVDDLRKRAGGNTKRP